jgi:hypothetical protein
VVGASSIAWLGLSSAAARSLLSRNAIAFSNDTRPGHGVMSIGFVDNPRDKLLLVLEQARDQRQRVHVRLEGVVDVELEQALPCLTGMPFELCRDDSSALFSNRKSSTNPVSG